MATAQEPTRASVTPHESFVEAQIAHARGRIRAHDLGVTALILTAGTLTFAVGMVLLDRWLQLPDLARQLALGAFVLASGTYAVIALSKPFRREVNPYYAARLVERSLPGAKNSVINWLDLRERPLPDAVHNALGLRAARDLREADVDEVVRDPRLGWLGWAVAALLLAAAVQFVILRPGQYASLLGRTFRPFTSASIAKRTGLELVKPAGGNVLVAVNRSIDFEVAVSGVVPSAGTDDAVRLRVRYNPADPAYEDKPLFQDPGDPRKWTLRLPSTQVQNGFVYRIVGGDAATPEFTVTVRSTPLVESYDVLYKFRPYLRFRDQETHNPNLEGLRGTRIELTAHANRVVAAGRLVFEPNEGQKDARPAVESQPVDGHPNAMRFAFDLEQDTKYRIHFKSVEGETNEDPLPYTIKVLSDFAPQVDITRPAADPLPINGALQIAGKASDDFGLTAMRLAMQLRKSIADEKPATLQSKKYRDGKSFRFADGTYPKLLDYNEMLPLEKLRNEFNLPLDLKKGMVLDYWLEADDNCDYPSPGTKKAPNTGRSKVYRVTIGDPQSEEDKKDRDAAARQEKADHDNRQDADHAKRNEEKQAAEDPNKPGPPEQHEEKKPSEEPKKGVDQKKPGDKSEGQQPKGDRKPQGKNADDDTVDPDKKATPPEDAPNPDATPKSKDLQSKADQIQRELDKARRDAERAEPKPDNQASGDPNPTPKGESKPDAAPKPNNTDKGESKPDNSGGQTAPQDKSPKGEAKPDKQPQLGEAKPNPSADSNRDASSGDSPKPDDATSQPNPRPDRQGEPKSKPDNKGSQAEKSGGTSKQPTPKSEGKNDASKPGDQGNKAGSDAKPGNQPPDFGENKPSSKPDAPVGEAKSPPKQESEAPGEAKPMLDNKSSDSTNKSGNDKQKSGDSRDKGDGKSTSEKDGPNGKPNRDQQKGDNKPGKQSGSGDSKAGDSQNKGEPKDAQQPGESESKAGDSHGKSEPKAGEKQGKSEPKAGGGKGKSEPKAGQPSAKGEPKASDSQNKGEPKSADGQGPDPKSGDKPGDGSSTGDPKTPNAPDANPKPGEGKAKSAQNPKPNNAAKGPGGEGGSNTSEGSQPNTGPKTKATDNDPKGQPQKDERSRDDGQGKSSSKFASDKPAPKGADTQPGQGKPRGDGELTDPKGEAKPDPSDMGQQGRGKDDADIKDAEKPHETRGDKPTASPKTDGKAAGDPKATSGTKEPGQPGDNAPADNGSKSEPGKTGRPSTEELKKASEALKNVAEDLGKMLKDKPPEQKPDPKTMKDAADRLKDLAKQMDDLKKVDPKAFDEITKNLDDAKKNLEKGGGDDLKKAAEEAAKAAEQARNAANEPRPDSPPTPGDHPSTKPSGQPNPKADSQAGPGSQGGTGPTGAGIGDNERGEGPDARNARRAGELQLEEFRKKVDKSVLDRLKMTEQEYRDFLAAYEAMLKRKPAAGPPAKDDRVRGDAKGNSAANTAARKIQSGPEGKGNLERGGAALPPPEFRDGYKGFTEDVSKTTKQPEKR
ncbi:MAG: hypothetical protein U0746_17900 [Gemmataceae bacterium]